MNNSNDTTKSLEKTNVAKTYGEEKAYDLLDKTAKGLSTSVERLEDYLSDKDKENSENLSDNKESSSKDKISRLKTSVKTETSDSFGNESNTVHNSKLKTGIKSDNQNSNERGTSKLKTFISNNVKKHYNFNENQGKISKLATFVGSTGKTFAKIERKATRASKDLEKAVNSNSDGTGSDFLKEKGKRIATKKIKKASNKVTKPITQKLSGLIKRIMVKAIKLIIAGVMAISEFVLPLAFVIIIIVSTLSIFSWGSGTTSSYESYMQDIQSSYDQEVNDFLRENPDGIVVGVKGGYGQIDWRVSLSILQGIGADLDFDNNEKELFDSFNEAGLFEKHEIIDQTITSDDPYESEKTIKVLVITNAGIDEYMSWCQDNFGVIRDYMNSKKLGGLYGSQDYFNDTQIETIYSLYESDNLFDEFDSKFNDYPVKYGSVSTEMDLSSDYYNDRNTLTTSGYKGQCTWLAFGRALEVSGRELPTGNAQTWLSSAVAMGFTTGSRPAPNSVAVLAGRKYGHVAYVESWDGEKITISEGNIGNACSDDTTCSQVEYANNHAEELVRTITYNSLQEYRDASKESGLYLVGFIYLD